MDPANSSSTGDRNIGLDDVWTTPEVAFFQQVASKSLKEYPSIPSFWNWRGVMTKAPAMLRGVISIRRADPRPTGAGGIRHSR